MDSVLVVRVQTGERVIGVKDEEVVVVGTIGVEVVGMTDVEVEEVIDVVVEEDVVVVEHLLVFSTQMLSPPFNESTVTCKMSFRKDSSSERI